MFKKNVVTGLAAAVAVVACTATAKADSHGGMADPMLLASNCYNCHGMNGASVGIIDGLDELSAKKMAAKMKEFRAGAKAATIMGRIAKGYNDAEIDAIAQYIESKNK